ncbi:MAG: tRNA-dihydrouridine synthase family protein [Lachnospiraceae bacterium]|nr:tRNA-dihydrouridine synthase family protein [Candidatus Equihabitans merdae]
MRYYTAPLEGITGWQFRQVHHRLFPGADKYYIPFMAPHLKGHLKNKEKTDVSPEKNEGFHAVPQVLTNDAESFIITAKMLKDLGYDEVNLNLGCPSPTVANKGKGSGFLGFPTELDHFLDEIYGALNGLVDVSVKTRIGVESPDEADALFAMYEKYPISELIIHPRTRKEFYRGIPHREIYDKVAASSKLTLCYNGNLYTPSDADGIQASSLMFGRGLLRNPALIREMQGGQALTVQELKAFHDGIFESYRTSFSGPAHLLGHMKELWVYWETILTEDSRKMVKAIRKARDIDTYEMACRQLFAGAELISTREMPRRTDNIIL